MLTGFSVKYMLLAPHTGHELFNGGKARQMRHGTHIDESVSKQGAVWAVYT